MAHNVIGENFTHINPSKYLHMHILTQSVGIAELLWRNIKKTMRMRILSSLSALD